MTDTVASVQKVLQYVDTTACRVCTVQVRNNKNNGGRSNTTKCARETTAIRVSSGGPSHRALLALAVLPLTAERLLGNPGEAPTPPDTWDPRPYPWPATRAPGARDPASARRPPRSASAATPSGPTTRGGGGASGRPRGRRPTARQRRGRGSRKAPPARAWMHTHKQVSQGGGRGCGGLPSGGRPRSRPRTHRVDMASTSAASITDCALLSPPPSRHPPTPNNKGNKT